VDELLGPVLAFASQGIFTVAEALHERRRSGPARSRPRMAAESGPVRQSLFWIRRIGHAIAFLEVGRLNRYAATWIPAGLALFAAGLFVRWLAILTLGRLFTRLLTIQSGHQLYTRGLYGVVRHPSYTGMVLCNVGIALQTCNWIGGLLIAGATVLLVLQRISLEEQMLDQAFGEEYERYRRRTKRLIPWIY
jgi:protein-S-isoprenylcysteine O-methyltransferase Ste14